LYLPEVLIPHETRDRKNTNELKKETKRGQNHGEFAYVLCTVNIFILLTMDFLWLLIHVTVFLGFGPAQETSQLQARKDLKMKSGNHEDLSKAISSQGNAAEESQPRPEATEGTGDYRPTDRGWAWVVCLGVCIVNFMTVGQQNSAGVVYAALMEEYSTPRGETGNR